MKTKLDPSKINLRWYFALIVLGEIAGTLLISVTVSTMAFSWIFKNETFWFVFMIAVLSLVIGFTFSIIFSRIISKPITVLSESMKLVSEGDFSIRLSTNSTVAEIVELYKSFNIMTKELGATEVLQTDFVSNVSHEFKTPINAIEGYATILQDPSLTADQQQSYIERIIFNTHRLSDLVGDILLLSKVDNQTILTKQSTFRLDEQIRQALVMTEPAWSAKEIEPDVDLHRIEITGNEAILTHVWLNLIGNAIKFDPNGGLLKLRLYTDNGKIIFTIEDSGPGIPEPERRRIFDKFYQSDSSHKSEGNGLGLALAKRIVDAYHGEISVEDGENGGAVFRVVL